MLGERGEQCLALLPQPRELVGQDGPGGEQPGQHELLEHRRAQVEAQPRPCQLLGHPRRHPHPAQPQPAPEGLAGAADGDRTGGVRRERPRHLLTVQRQGLQRLVHDGDRAGGAQVAGVLLALGVAHQVPGGVLEVRHEVGQRRADLAQLGAHGREVPALGVDGRADEPTAGVAQRERGVGVDRRLHEHPVAAPGQRLRHDRGARERPGGDDHLGGVGGQPALLEPAGHLGLQVGEPGGEVPVPTEVRRQLAHRLGVGVREPGRGHRGGAAEVDPVGVADRELVGRQGAVAGAGPPAGHPGEGAGALPGHGVPGLAQLGVGAGDRGPRDTEGVGQLALAGQPDVGADPAVPDGQHESVGETGVGGGAVEAVDQGGDPGRRDRPQGARGRDGAGLGHAVH
ncbi:hypothetical protein NOMA109596_10085 [Nocardioides marinus]